MSAAKLSGAEQRLGVTRLAAARAGGGAGHLSEVDELGAIALSERRGLPRCTGRRRAVQDVALAAAEQLDDVDAPEEGVLENHARGPLAASAHGAWFYVRGLTLERASRSELAAAPEVWLAACVTREELVAMTAMQRKALLEDVAALVHSGEWRFGDAVRFLRAVVLRKNREKFAQIVGISPAALQKLEDRSDANPTLDTLNRVLRPFGGAVGIVFPRMEPPPLPTVDSERRHAALKADLAKTHRRKPARGRAARSSADGTAPPER